MKIDELNMRIEKNKEKYEKLERNEKIILTNRNKEKRRKRVRNLIMLGALFEIENLHRENASSLLGFLHENKELFIKYKEKYFEIGESIFQNRKESKNNLTNEIGKNEIKELLQLSNIFKSKNQDLGVFIQERFKKKLFEELTIKEFHIIKNYILEK